MTSINAQVASAIRFANALYLRLPDDEERDRFAENWIDLERQVTCAETSGDIATVENLVGDWRRHVTDQFEELSK
jgi:hypothetical protein